ncbi:MAG: response regulator [Ginsengibacter sp.]
MKRNILCIEKNRSICFLINTLFKEKYTVLTVSDNLLAMDQINSGTEIDTIIISLENSEDETVELLYHLGSSSLLRNIPIVVLSNSTYEELKSVCMKSNVHAFFTKPFNPIDLIEKINQTMLIDKHSQILHNKRKVFNLN